MDLIGPEHLELFALDLKKMPISLCLHSSIYKYQSISTKLGQNIYDYKISDEFSFGSNRTRTTGVICPWIKKCYISLCLHSSIYKYQPISTKLVQNIYDCKTSDEFDFGSKRTRMIRVICPWIKKKCYFDFVYSLASTIFNQSTLNVAKVYITIRS